MRCGGCERKVTEALSALAEVREVHADRTQDRVRVDAPSETTDALIAALETLGYTATVGAAPALEPGIEPADDAAPAPDAPDARTETPDLSPGRVFLIEGMTCASCVARVEQAIAAVPGVTHASVNLITSTAQVWERTTDDGAIAAAIANAGYQATEQQAARDPFTIREPQTASHWTPRIAFSLVIGVVAMVVSMPLMHGDPAHAADPLMRLMHPIDAALSAMWPALYTAPAGTLRWALLVMTAPVLFWAGRHFFVRAWTIARHGGADMNTLIALGTGAAFGWSSAVTLAPDAIARAGLPMSVWFETVPWVIGLVMLGNALEDRAKRKTTDALRALAALRPTTARVVRGGQELDVPIDEVRRDDRVRVRPGERVPVDGVVAEGHSAVDEAMLTGESMPILKQIGDAVLGGTQNTSGALLITPTTLGRASSLARILQIVEDAQAAKPEVQRVADRVASVFVPVVVAVAVLSSGLWLLLGPEPAGAYALQALLTVLIIACPCAMGLAVPTAVMVATGRAARSGLLIRSGATLETGHRVDTVVFDKTGTLTEGRPSVAGASWVRDDGLLLAAAVERGSEHPFAAAIVRHAEAADLPAVSAEGVQAHAGRGVSGQVRGQAVRVGVPAWVLGDLTEPLPAAVLATLPPDLCEQLLNDAEAGRTTLLVSVDSELAGALTMTDAAKPSAAAAVATLRAQGIYTVLLSGDRRETAEAMGASLGLDAVYGGMRPDDKVAVIAELQAAGRVVAMVGDGINDAGALAAANVGIAMAGGTDIAMGAADVTIASSDPAAVADVLALSRQTMRVIRQNLGWAFGYNTLGIPIAAGALFPVFGILLSPVFASVAMAMSSVSVVTNSLRLARTGRKPR